MEIFDENKAIERMRQAIPSDIAAGLDDDEFINILDMIMDWMDENGLTDVDADEDDIDADRDKLERELTDYVKKMLAKDKGAGIPVEYAGQIVAAELDYEDEISTL